MLEDFHAARVLPGYEPDNKSSSFRAKIGVEVVIAISAIAISSTLRQVVTLAFPTAKRSFVWLINSAAQYLCGFCCCAQYSGQPAADAFRNQLEKNGMHHYIHYPIGLSSGYEPPFLPEEYGKMAISRLAHVTLSSLLLLVLVLVNWHVSNMYHDKSVSIKSGYAKFGNLPSLEFALHHPVNLAYETATASLDDQYDWPIPTWKLMAKLRWSYNRDIEIFPVLKRMLRHVAVSHLTLHLRIARC